jgi:MFS family permease
VGSSIIARDPRRRLAPLGSAPPVAGRRSPVAAALVQSRALSRPLIALSAAVVAFAFQQTAVVPAIPTIEHDLAAPRAWTAWLVTGYLVAASVATPLLGSLGDRFGRRRVMLGAMAAFLLGSVGAALAPGIGALIAFRLLQGAGGAVFPLALAMARDALPDRLAHTAGILTGAFGVGTSLGLGLAGVIVELASWRWVFASGAAVIAVAMAGIAAFVPAAGPRRQAPLDLVGAALLTGGLGTVLLALTEHWWWLLAGSAGLFAAWYSHERRARAPLLGLEVLRRRAVLATNGAGLLLGYIMFGVYVLVPYLVEEELRAGPILVGVYLLPSALGQVVAGPLAGRLTRRTSPATAYACGIALAALSAGGLGVWHSSPIAVMVGMGVLGAGIGLAIGVGSAVITASAPDTETGVATSLNAVLRRVGGSVGGQAGAAVLAAGGGFEIAFGLCAVVGVAGALAATRV